MSDYYYTDGLETERLVTRFLIGDDWKIWMHFFEDDEAVEFHPNVHNHSNKERAKIWIDRQLGRYNHSQYGHQALINKSTGKFVGQCGLILQDVNGVPELEIGYHIFKEYWGQGYAPEAAARFKDFGFEHDQNDSVVSLIDINNLKSQKVAVKNGMERENQIFRAGHDIFIYRISREAWQESRVNLAVSN